MWMARIRVSENHFLCNKCNVVQKTESLTSHGSLKMALIRNLSLFISWMIFSLVEIIFGRKKTKDLVAKMDCTFVGTLQK